MARFFALSSLLVLLGCNGLENSDSYNSIYSDNGIETYQLIMTKVRGIEAQLRDQYGIESIETEGFEFKVRDLMAYVRQLQVIHQTYEQLWSECAGMQDRRECRFTKIKDIKRIQIQMTSGTCDARYLREDKTLVDRIDEDFLPAFGAGEVFGIYYRLAERAGTLTSEGQARVVSKIYIDIVQPQDLERALLVNTQKFSPGLKKAALRESLITPAAEVIEIPSRDGISVFRETSLWITSLEETLKQYGVKSFTVSSLSFAERDIVAYAGQLKTLISVVERIEAVSPGGETRLNFTRLSVDSTAMTAAYEIHEEQGERVLHMMMDSERFWVYFWNDLGMIGYRLTDGVVSIEDRSLAEVEAKGRYDLPAESELLEALILNEPVR